MTCTHIDIFQTRRYVYYIPDGLYLCSLQSEGTASVTDRSPVWRARLIKCVEGIQVAYRTHETGRYELYTCRARHVGVTGAEGSIQRCGYEHLCGPGPVRWFSKI